GEADPAQRVAIGAAAKNQTDQRGHGERQDEIDEPRQRIAPGPVQIFGEEDAQHFYPLKSLPVSCRKTSFKLGRLSVTFSTRTGSPSKSFKHSDGSRTP